MSPSPLTMALVMGTSTQGAFDDVSTHVTEHPAQGLARVGCSSAATFSQPTGFL